MRAALIATAVLIAAPSVKSQDADHERLKGLPIAQAYAELLELEGGSDLEIPVGAFFYLARLSLANLSYAVDLRSPTAPLTDPETVAVVREFEEKAGLEADGSLTWAELDRLMTLSNLAKLTPLWLPSGKYVSTSEALGEIYATGSWTMPDIAFPLNFSEITCELDRQICHERVVWVSAPSLTGSNASFSSYSITTHSDFYEIESWENGILEAKAVSSCRQVRLSINTRTELVTQTAQDTDPQGCPLPYSELRLPPIGGLRVATLIDPREARTTHFDGIQAATNAVRGSAMDGLLPSE